MAIRIRFQYATGASLGYSVERLSDGYYLDFSDGIFRTSPATIISTILEDAAPFRGRFRTTMTPTPSSQFIDGNYAVHFHDQRALNLVVGVLGLTTMSGDDTLSFPDPWSASLPASYGPGTAGALVGMNLDAKVSSRSVYAGGAVSNVIGPVTVGTNNDKSGYQLSPIGLDSITIEPGVNARQAMSPVLAAAAGVLSGAGTGTIVIKGGNTSTSRIIASTDNSGNRMSITLNLPT